MSSIEGVILAGGLGSRLMPLTASKPKCLVYVLGKPMIRYALNQLRDASVHRITVVCPAAHILEVRQHLAMTISLVPEYQARGAVGALAAAEVTAGGADSIIVGMVDCFTTFNAPIRLASAAQPAAVMVARVNDVSPYGAARLDTASGTIAEIKEKPDKGFSDWAVIGWYSYPNDVFDRIWELPRDRELSISDLNKSYCIDNKLSFVRVREDEDWCDAGTHEGLAKAEGIIEDYSSDR